MKRASGVLMILLLLLGLIIVSGRNVHSANTKAGAAKKLGKVAPPQAGTLLTIIFRGLMVFKPDPADQFLEVGILSAPQHEYTMQVLEKSADGLSSSSIYSGQLTDRKSDVWSLEFPRSASSVTFYKGQAFDRRSGKGDPRDYRWLIDLESAEFHGRKLSVDNNKLRLILQVKGGEFYTKTTTLPLIRRQGDGSFEYFGRAALEIAADVLLEDGDMVLRSETSAAELLRLKPKPDTTYELVFENLSQRHHQLAMNFNHFQYYYRLFPMLRTEWFEFKVASRAKTTSVNFLKATFATPGSDEAPCMGAGYGNGGTGGGR